MSFVRHDIRDACRALLRSRAYTLVVIATLGLGIGINTAIFTIVDALLLKPLPYPDAERIVRVAEWPRSGGNYTVAPAAFLRWRDAVRSFSHFEARIAGPIALVTGESTEEVQGARITPGYFDLLGIRAVRGRAFTSDDATAGECAVVVSHRLWSTRLGGESPSGARSARFGGRACTILGVLPPDSVFDRAPIEAYFPLAFSAADAQSNGRMLTVLARLRDGVPIEQARAEMTALADVFNAERGPAGRGWTTAVTPLRDVVIRADSRWLAAVLSGAVVAVLLVACLNVAGLSLSRTATRRREIAIRTALGASRWRVFRYLVTESLLIAAAGGGVAVLFGSWGLRTFTVLAPPGTLPPEAAAALDGRALAFTAAVSLLTGLLFGTVPALRGASVNPAEALAASGRVAGPSRWIARVRGVLLVVEVALAMALTVAAVSLAVSFLRLTNVPPGFTPEHVLTMRLTLPRERYAADEAAARVVEQAMQSFRQIPGVQNAGAVTSLPLGGWLFGTTFAVLGEPQDPERPTSAHIQHATDGYFEALGITLVEGRTFTSSDNARGPLVAVVNQTLAKRFIPRGSAVGRQLQLGITRPGGGGATWDIVGVVADVKTGGLADGELATPEIYVPYAQSPMPTVFAAARVIPGQESPAARALRAALRSIDAEVPAGEVIPMEDRLGRSVRAQRFRTVMISSSAVLALLLACLGVFAVRSHAVSARLREIGIRQALGATRPQLMAMVLNQAMRQVALGAGAGLLLSAWLARFIEPWLFQTRASDGRILFAAAVLLGIAALAASWIPARRAATIDLSALLREE